MNFNVCNVTASLLLVIHHVIVRVGAIDSHVRAGPKEGSCFQFLSHGSDPDLGRGGEGRVE